MGAAHMIPGGVRHGRIRGLGLGLLLLLAALLLVLRPHATAQAFVLKTPRRTSVCISPVRAPALVLQAATAPLPPPPAKEDDIDPASLIPGPLSPLQRIQRAATFWSRVVPILGNYAMIRRKLETAKEKGEPIPEAEETKLWEEAHDWGSERLASTIGDLKGFYVKSGQVISTRVDMFPKQYTDRLQKLQDAVDPIPASVVKAVIRQDLLEGEPMEVMFKEFDDKPLGSASIAQVHRAVLVDGRTVAIKVQRPSEEPKLRGDIGNLKAFSKRFRDSLPVDYYKVFCELERALTNELDFLAEAQAMEKIAAAVAHTPDGHADVAPVTIPRPIPGLFSKRVLVMDFIEGVPLSRLKETMKERGIEEGSPESAIFGRRLLNALTEAYARMLFGPGFIHGDCHPGNIFVQPGGRIALIDCGQVKQIPASTKLRLADLVLGVSRYSKAPSPAAAAALSEKVKAFGVEFTEDARPEIGAALALLLFGSTSTELPGGYSSKELSAESPLRAINSFPEELVMLGRATVIIKGIASRLGVPWNLAEKFAHAAKTALECGEEGCALPIYAKIAPVRLGKEVPRTAGGQGGASRRRFSEVRDAFRVVRQVTKEWVAGKVWDLAPERVKQFLIQRELRRMKKREEAEEAEAAAANQKAAAPAASAAESEA